MAGKKKWLGLAALAAAIVALMRRGRKDAAESEGDGSTMET